MKRQILNLLLLLLPCLGLGQISWDGGAGTTDWQDANNWNPDGVPGSSALIEIGTNITITGTAPNIPAQIKVLNGNTLTLDLSLTVGDGVTVEHALQINANATLNIASGNTITVNPPTNRNGVSIFGSGNNAIFNIASGATLNVSQAQHGISIANATCSATNAGTIITGNTTGEGIRVAGGSFNNSGQITVNIPVGAGTNENAVDVASGASFTNSGSFSSSGGNTTQRLFIDGTFTNDVGSTLDLGSARMRVNDGSLINNGLITSTFSGSAIFIAGTGSTTNNGFFSYNGSGLFASGSGTNTDNGIDLNDSSETTIDAGNSCTVKIANAAYEYFDGANSVGTTDGSGSITFAMDALSSDPVVLTNSLMGVAITIENICSDAVLPIELTYFRAVAMEKEVMIKWQTALEINNDYMAVERSRDGRNFTEIGRLAGAGHSTQTLDYEIKDIAPLSGKSYYRLRQVDFDGTTSYSEVSTVNFKSDNPGFLVYPTLIQGQAELSIDLTTLPEKAFTVDVFTASGQWLSSHQLTGGNLETLSVAALNPGVYLLKIRNGQTFPPVRIMKIQ